MNPNQTYRPREIAYLFPIGTILRDHPDTHYEYIVVGKSELNSKLYCTYRQYRTYTGKQNQEGWRNISTDLYWEFRSKCLLEVESIPK